MTAIIAGQPAKFTVTMLRDGVPVAIEPGAAVTVRLYSEDGMTPLMADAVDLVTPDGGWPDGSVVVELAGADTADMEPGETMLVVSSTMPALVKRFRVVVQTADTFERSGLFVKDIAVDKLRAETLMLAAAGAFPGVTVTDDYLWGKLRAAESEMAHELRVPLVPTKFFFEQPTPEQIAALGAMPWAIDAGYDYTPGDFAFNDKWGFVKMRNKPLRDVQKVRFAYPGGKTAQYDLPLDWLRVDAKYGHVQFVPSSTSFAAPINTFVMQAIGGGRTIPLAMCFEYVAGLENAHKNYPELIDAIMKMATLKVLEDAFLPQSGSISADGLSQSMSNDMDKHRSTIDNIINGGKGSNGGLMTAIHGIRFGVMGG
jgi:hypothetical protein